MLRLAAATLPNFCCFLRGGRKGVYVEGGVMACFPSFPPPPRKPTSNNGSPALRHRKWVCGGAVLLQVSQLGNKVRFGAEPKEKGFLLLPIRPLRKRKIKCSVPILPSHPPPALPPPLYSTRKHEVPNSITPEGGEGYFLSFLTNFPY